MDEFIEQSLDNIEQMARKIVAEIRGIYGYCNGMETVANDYQPFPALQINQEIVSTENTEKEDKYA